MKKFLPFLSLLLLLGGACQAAALDTDRSFLNAQKEQDKVLGGAFMSMLSDRDSEKAKFTLMTTPFYSRTFDGIKLGQYFGSVGSNVVTLKKTPKAGNAELSYDSVFRDTTVVPGGPIAAGASAGAIAGSQAAIRLEPWQKSVGAHFAVSVQFGEGFESFSVAINTAVVQNTTNLQSSFINDLAYNNPLVAVAPSTFADYLAGNGSSAYQAALTSAKIDGKSHETVRTSDIDVQVRYAITDEEKEALTVFADLLIPTGNKPSGEFLLEPIAGNHSWFVGAGARGRVQLYSPSTSSGLPGDDSDDSRNVWLAGDVLYRYGLTSTQIRVPDIQNTVWGKYRLTVTAAQPAIAALTSQFVPAANALVQKFKVTPRSTFMTNLRVCMTYKKTAAEFGYQVCHKQEEANHFDTPWVDNAIYLIAPAYSPAISAAANIALATPTATPINHDNLQLNHPAQTFHTFFGSVGMTGDVDAVSWAFALGGAVNFSNEARVAPRSWDGFVKVGIAF